MAAENGWDPLVVATAPLADFLQLWVEQWDWDEDHEVSIASKGGIDRLGPVAWLAVDSKINERSIRRILLRETKFTVLPIAEALVNAVGRPDLLSPGGLIEVVANPQMRADHWQAWYAERTCVE